MNTLPLAVFAMLTAWLVPGLVLAQERPYEWGWGIPNVVDGWRVGSRDDVNDAVVPGFGIIAGLLFGIRWLMSQSRDGHSDSAIEILRQRYARGEINKDEFDAKK